jgi:cyclopropane-fatty-acyl-phospholipid synthase
VVSPIIARRRKVIVRLDIALMEQGLVARPLIRQGIRRLLARRLSAEREGGLEEQESRRREFLAEMDASPLAIHTADANQQHYELPTEFFRLCLGKRLKYSCALWTEEARTLDQAEEAMLSLYCERARLEPGQHVLELGCGWGSLSLFMAERFPQSRITVVSNSRTQREFIESRARELNLTNLTVITCDMNHFDPGATFDRIVSVEMFEHMRNWKLLFSRIASWLNPAGLLFFHIFTHRHFTYPYIAENDDDWMARYFFSGGMMPADDLPLHFQDQLAIIDHWRVSGRHYGRTAAAWLANMDANRLRIEPILAQTYGASQVMRWRTRWEVFFLACEELWNYESGTEWLVSHYLFRRR